MFQSDFGDFDGVGLGSLIRRGEVSSYEIVASAINRAENVNPLLNAVVGKFYESALEQSRRVSATSSFAGVPFLLKDIRCEYAGFPMTSGSRFLASHVPQFSCELVRRFLSAGLIPIGTTNTPEFGIMGVTEPKLHGPTLNPWHLSYSPGGSSGGAAASVASGIVPMAHGGDGGGSIRIPSSACGLFGLKPTRGRTPMGPERGEAWAGYAVDHVLTRSVRDSATMLDIVAGVDPGAFYSESSDDGCFASQLSQKPGRLKIAFSAEPLFGEITHPDCERALETAVELCARLGHDVIEARPEFDRHSCVRAYLTTVCASVAREIEKAETHNNRKAGSDHLEDVTRFVRTVGDAITAVEFLQAREVANRTARNLVSFFESYDVFMLPTLAFPPPKIGAQPLGLFKRVGMRLMRAFPVKPVVSAAIGQFAEAAMNLMPNTQLFNQTGNPAMSVPLYWNRNGLPIGIQFAAGFAKEALLLRLASQLEQAQPWFQKRPPMVEQSNRLPSCRVGA